MIDTFTYRTPVDESAGILIANLAKANNVYHSEVCLVQKRWCCTESIWSIILQGEAENIDSFKKSARKVVIDHNKY